MKATRKMILLAKQEATYGQDAAPGPAHAIVFADASFSVEAEKLTRNMERTTFTPPKTLVGASVQRLSGSCEFKGGGLDAGGLLQAPDWEPLLLACGYLKAPLALLCLASVDGLAVGDEVQGATSLAEGVVRFVDAGRKLVGVETSGTFQDGESLEFGTSNAAIAGVPGAAFEYRPTSDTEGMKSASALFYRDGIRHKLLGVQGTFSVDLQAGKFGALKFDLSGLWVDPQDDANPAPVFSSAEPPKVESIAFKIGDFAPTAQALSLSLGAKISKRWDVNSAEGMAGLRITAREPKGSFNPEAVALGDFNPWSAWRQSTGAAWACVVGKDPGNRIRLSGAQACFDEVRYGDRDGTLTYDIPIVLSGDGDDELILHVY